jgi:branched-chain amino acid transport system ATP-binding protein
VSLVPLIAVEALVCGYEPGVPIVNGVSMRVEPGEIVAVLGPNGAGKSTLVKSVAGLVPISSGRILCDGQDLSGWSVHERVRRGFAYVPQVANVFAALSVVDNLKVSAQLLPAPRRRSAIASMCDLFPDLSRQRAIAAGRLSGGQRQMLAVARALIVSPRALLLDEPSAGLSPKSVRELFDKLKEIRSSVGILLVEQNVRAAFSIADRAYVLVEGRNRIDGAASSLAVDPQVAALYLGGRETVSMQGVRH